MYERMVRNDRNTSKLLRSSKINKDSSIKISNRESITKHGKSPVYVISSAIAEVVRGAVNGLVVRVLDSGH